MKPLIIFLTAVVITTNSMAQIVMIGPMFQFNLTKDKPRTAFAIEASYWNVQGFPYGFDAAIEFGKKKVRFYSEAQTGIGVLGVAAGPFVEFGSGRPRAGWQLTGWANYYIGVDVRKRFYKGPDVMSGGIYAKLPAWIGEELKDSDGSSSHDWGDWD